MQNAQFQRVAVLMQQSRYPDAEAALREILSENPDNPQALQILAIVFYHMDREQDALGAIDASLQLDPDVDRSHAWRALILLGLRRFDEAFASAAHALELDPEDPFNWTVQAQIHLEKRQWTDAERSARKALELDGDDQSAHHILSRVLLMQGRGAENEENLKRLLGRDPENPLAHCNAGYAALRRGDHRKASEHFMEALRLDSTFKAAREGLIESFRARSAFYRAHLAFSFRVAALTEKMGMFLFLGIYLIYRVCLHLLKSYHPALMPALIALYLMFVFWSYVSRGLSTLIILADRFARKALYPREKCEALIVGGGFAAGAVLLVAGFCGLGSRAILTGIALLAQTIPASIFFVRESRIGRLVYGAMASITWAAALVFLAGVWVPGDATAWANPAALVGVWTVAITTFMAVFRVAPR